MFSPGDCESLVKSFSLPLLRISEVCLGSLFCCRSNPHFIFSIFTETVIFLKNLMVFNRIHTSLNKAHSVIHQNLGITGEVFFFLDFVISPNLPLLRVATVSTQSMRVVCRMCHAYPTAHLQTSDPVFSGEIAGKLFF